MESNRKGRDEKQMAEPLPGIRPQQLQKLLRGLVDIYSPSGKEEEIVGFLDRYIRRRGLPTVLQPVGESRSNLLVLPQEPDLHLALVGHVDTVAAYELDDFGYVEKGDVITGLGTADMKGGCAAMIEAFLAFWEYTAGRFPVALCMVVGEEEESDGAEELVGEYHFPWAIIGEPTDLKPCLSHYGYLEMHVTTLGRRVHASLAKTKGNAVEAMLRVMLDLSRHVEIHRPDLVYNIRDLFSSQAGFAVPERCEAWLDVHLPPSSPVAEIASEIEEIATRTRGKETGVETKVRIETVDAGYELPEKGPTVDALRAVHERRSLAWEPEPFRSHSDANSLWASGVKTILLGPGQLEKAHTPEESVSFSQVCLAAEIYLDLLVTMFVPGKEGKKETQSP
ncbi:M20 family metallopeptidase [Thermodesulfobacteriota bacterium]